MSRSFPTGGSSPFPCSCLLRYCAIGVSSVWGGTGIRASSSCRDRNPSDEVRTAFFATPTIWSSASSFLHCPLPSRLTRRRSCSRCSMPGCCLKSASPSSSKPFTRDGIHKQKTRPRFHGVEIFLFLSCLFSLQSGYRRKDPYSIP